MVENDILRAGNLKRADLRACLIAQTKAHVTNYHIARGNAEHPARNANATARRALSGNRQKWFRDRKSPLEKNRSRNAKHDDARAFALDGRAKTAGDRRLAIRPVVILEVRHEQHLAAAAAGSECAESLSARKCGKIFVRGPTRDYRA